MNRPNLFIVGAPKCGTTAWHSYLSTHPDISFSPEKEPHYFNTDMPGFRWYTDEPTYLSLFNSCSGTKLVGEASVQYLSSTHAAANIAQFSPDAKILIFLRNPAPFIKSYHNQLLLNLDEDIPNLASAWIASASLSTRNLPKSCREPSLLDYHAKSLFGQQVARYLDHFAPEQIMLIPFETWTREPRDTYLRIMTFLDVDDDGRTEFSKVHEAKQMASKHLAHLTQRPPGWALWVARGLKKLLGRERLGLAQTLRQANRRSGYSTPQDAEIAAEIAEFCRNDQTLLAELSARIEASHG